MEIYRTVTATGTGTWDQTYDVNLSKIEQIYTARFGHARKTVTRYELRYKLPRSVSWDWVTFPSEIERSNFMAQSFSKLDLTAMDPLELDLATYLPREIVGEKLIEITFILNYLQIRFNGQTFSFFEWPMIDCAGQTYQITDKEYRNVLCDLIGHEVMRVEEYLDLGLALEFDTGALVHVSLSSDQGFSLPEIASYRGANHELYIWGVGDEPFE